MNLKDLLIELDIYYNPFRYARCSLNLSKKWMAHSINITQTEWQAYETGRKEITLKELTYFKSMYPHAFVFDNAYNKLFERLSENTHE
jgi:hypothetical protein